MAREGVQNLEREYRSGGATSRSGGQIGLERDLCLLRQALNFGRDEGFQDDMRGPTGLFQPNLNYPGAANAFPLEEGFSEGRGVNWMPMEQAGGHHILPPWQERMEWQADSYSGDRVYPQAGPPQWQDTRWEMGPQDGRGSGVEQPHQIPQAYHPPVPLHPTPRYPSNQYNWRELVPQRRDSQLRRAAPPWRMDRPGPSRLGRSTSEDWRNPGRAGGGGIRESDWRDRGRQEGYGWGGGGDAERPPPRGDKPLFRPGSQQDSRGNLNQIQEDTDRTEKRLGDLSRSSASSHSRVRWGSEWYEGERASEHSKDDRSSMLSSATSKNSENERSKDDDPMTQLQDRRADTLQKSQAEKVQRRLIPLLCTMANNGAYFLALAQPDGLPLLPSIDVESLRPHLTFLI
ncbi:hypothetical protein CBR_g40144 [Chara braunii]|uniref:Uncharacterized protein n=1 Tax=Chara braunii TaxID=69332 RepID=A0A388LTB5_CHABU|nr:hypothetical protein CBR_g40144 [Chara braunii]|eukprot:GBG85505.1 hypothetical protein CBR_g40144 [Chara braunii]